MEGFSEEVPFEQIPQGGKGVNPMNSWEKGTPDRHVQRACGRSVFGIF